MTFGWSPVRAAVSLALAAGVAGCGGPDYGAALPPDAPEPSLEHEAAAYVAGQFAREFICPIDRVQVAQDAAVVDRPPPEIAADPERLVMWSEKTRRDLAKARFFMVHGCDRAAAFTCVAVRHGERAVCTMTQRGRLGVSIHAITRAVEEVLPNSVGERVGFRVGDVILQLDHQPVSDIADLVRRIGDPSSPGHVVTVLRIGAPLDLKVPHLND